MRRTWARPSSGGSEEWSEEESGPENEAERIAALRAKVRQAEMVRELVEESLNGNYDEFITSLGSFKTVTDQQYQDQIDSEIASFDDTNESQDQLDRMRLATEISALSQQNKTLTEKRDRLLAENKKLEQLSRDGEEDTDEHCYS
jgi:putative cell wall-binding protein